MPYIPLPANTTGLDGLFNYTKLALEGQYSGIGGSIIGLALLMPLWFIIFLALARINPVAAFTVASFICWILVHFLIALQYINPLAYGVFFAMWIAGAIGYYLQSRS